MSSWRERIEQRQQSELRKLTLEAIELLEETLAKAGLQVQAGHELEFQLIYHHIDESEEILRSDALVPKAAAAFKKDGSPIHDFHSENDLWGMEIATNPTSLVRSIKLMEGLKDFLRKNTRDGFAEYDEAGIPTTAERERLLASVAEYDVDDVQFVPNYRDKGYGLHVNISLNHNGVNLFDEQHYGYDVRPAEAYFRDCALKGLREMLASDAAFLFPEDEFFARLQEGVKGGVPKTPNDAARARFKEGADSRAENRLPGADADVALSTLVTLAGLVHGIRHLLPEINFDAQERLNVPMQSMERVDLTVPEKLPKHRDDALETLRDSGRLMPLLDALSGDRKLGTQLQEAYLNPPARTR